MQRKPYRAWFECIAGCGTTYQLNEVVYRCEKCGEPMELKMGPRGPFLGCSAYPKCKSTLSIKKAEQKRQEAQADAGGAPEPEHGLCPECMKKLYPELKVEEDEGPEPA